jgi:hypothetical protein
MMMRSIFILLIVLGAGLKGKAQNCLHTNLSSKYNYQLSVSEVPGKNGLLRISKIYLKVINKSTGFEEQTITVNTGRHAQFSKDCFRDCNDVRSDLTRVNTKANNTSADQDDLIVTDLNFDGIEDLMVKIDCSTTGKASYAFFTRNENGLYVEDRFLTREFKRYPNALNEKSKTVSMIENVNAWGKTENVYTYDSGAKKWVRIKTLFH